MATATNRPLAVVTGASSGIGFELAKQCAEHGFDLLVCADDEQRLEQSAERLRTAGTSVETVRADLATYEGNEELARAVRALGRPVDALLLNAGIGVNGKFVETSLDEELRSIGLNCAAVVHAAKRIIPDMVARGSGRVLITGSILSTAPSPFMAVYGATKAFDLSFAEALRVELKDSGVTVTALQPGATDTDFFERAHMEDTPVGKGKKDDPAAVAKAGFEAMMKGKDSVIAASMKSKLQGLAHEILPETAKARLQAQMVKPGSGDKS
jgi:short-subunit dehydrogenase